MVTVNTVFAKNKVLINENTNFVGQQRPDAPFRILNTLVNTDKKDILNTMSSVIIVVIFVFLYHFHDSFLRRAFVPLFWVNY
jgi:hypothetical protein